MQIIPAIDIIDGKCVRLTRGQYESQVIYHEKPLDAARLFEDGGLTRLHIVDLDGAKKRSIQNLKSLEVIAANTNLVIDFGGGINTIEDISRVFNAGASIATLGSVVARHPEMVEEWLLEFGAGKILVGADVLDDKIMISGWLQDAGLSLMEFIGKTAALGVQQVFCTDISKDGMMKGPAIEMYKKIMAEFPILELIASGGVSNISDVVALQEIGCKGVIIGKAIYEGKIAMKQLSSINSQS